MANTIPKYVTFNGLGDTLIKQPGALYALASEADIIRDIENPQHVHKDSARCYVLSSYNANDAREHEAQRARGLFHAIWFDVDEGDVDPTRLQTIASSSLGGCRVHAYATASSVPGARRCRLVVPLSAPVPGAWYAPTVRAVMDRLMDATEEAGFLVQFDRCSMHEAQFLYGPNAGEHYIGLPGVGPALSLADDAELGQDIIANEAEYREFLDRKRKPVEANDGRTIADFNNHVNPDALLTAAGFTTRNGINWHHDSQSTDSYALKLHVDEGGNWGFMCRSETLIKSGLGVRTKNGCAGDMWAIYRWAFTGNSDHDAVVLHIAESQFGYDRRVHAGVTPVQWLQHYVDHGKSLWTDEVFQLLKARQGTIVLNASADIEASKQGALFKLKNANEGGGLKVREYICDPFYVRGEVNSVSGEGGSAKSTLVSQQCSSVSDKFVTLWITSEEDEDNVLARYTACGGQPESIHVLTYMPEFVNNKARGIFDIREHLSRCIADSVQKAASEAPGKELGLVVLDAASTLIKWDKGESENDNNAVKRILAYMFSVAQEYNVAIIIIGHVTKKPAQKKRTAMDILGSGAWTNSVRQAVICLADLDAPEEYTYVAYSVKRNLGAQFGIQYKTKPVIVVTERGEGEADDVLCGVDFTTPRPVWGTRAVDALLGCEREETGVKASPAAKRFQRRLALVTAVMHVLKDGLPRQRVDLVAAIKEDLGGTVRNEELAEMTAELAAAPNNVTITKGAHNTFTYQRKSA